MANCWNRTFWIRKFLGSSDGHCINAVAVAETIHQVARCCKSDPSTVLVLSNICIFGAWGLVDKMNVHRAATWMEKHMVYSLDKRLPHTLLTSAFMHASLDHLASINKSEGIMDTSSIEMPVAVNAGRSTVTVTFTM